MKTFRSFPILLFVSTLLFFFSCNSDSCDNSLCLNGGVCLNGSCDCPDRFTGPDCSEQKTPDKMEIRTIKVTRFPDLNDGSEWDLTDGPDLYFRLLEGESTLAQPMLTVDNAEFTQAYYFFVESIFMKNVLKEHTLQLRDYDPEDDDDFMGEVKFLPYQFTNGFPSVITWDDGGPIAFTAEVEYIHKDLR